MNIFKSIELCCTSKSTFILVISNNESSKKTDQVFSKALD